MSEVANMSGGAGGFSLDTHVDVDLGNIHNLSRYLRKLEGSLSEFKDNANSISQEARHGWSGDAAEEFATYQNNTLNRTLSILADRCQDYEKAVSEFLVEIMGVLQNFARMRSDAEKLGFIVTPGKITVPPSPTPEDAVMKAQQFKNFLDQWKNLRSMEAQAHNSLQAKSKHCARLDVHKGIVSNFLPPSMTSKSSLGLGFDNFKDNAWGVGNVDNIRKLAPKFGIMNVGPLGQAMSAISSLGDAAVAFREQWDRDSYDPTLDGTEKVIRGGFQAAYSASPLLGVLYGGEIGGEIGGAIGAAAGASGGPGGAAAGGTAGGAAGGVVGGLIGGAFSDVFKRETEAGFSEIVDKNVREHKR